MERRRGHQETNSQKADDQEGLGFDKVLDVPESGFGIELPFNSPRAGWQVGGMVS
jgi:hypothetical protein